MAKKFFDIIPPQKIEYSPGKIELGRKTTSKKPGFKLKKGSKSAFLKGLIFCSVFLILIGAFGFFFFSKIKIDIWPETEVLTFEETVFIDPEAENIDFENKIISGEIFNDEKFGFQEFFSSGKVSKEEKAKGIIKVYNNYSTSGQGLLPNTRFVSTDGKLFRSVKKEVIAGGKYVKGKFVPGETDIEVQAAEPGEEYNIEPSTFSIPGFKGTPKYTFFYGKSFSPMTGGFMDEVSQVIKKDLDRAENSLAEELKRESREFLKLSLLQDFVLLDEAIVQEIIESSSSAEAGTQADSFDFQVKVKSEGIGFKESDIENFAKNFINQKIPENKKIQEGSLKINYSFLSSVLAGKAGEGSLTNGIDETGKLILNLDFEAKVFQDIDLVGLKKSLLGDSVKESKLLLEDLPEITKVEIKSWPFWRKKIPESLEGLEIRLVLD